MTSRVTTGQERWRVLHVRTPGRHAVTIVCAYVASFVALDWISSVQVLPQLGLTLWNPPPAASLALLVLKGLSFAPTLFVASVVSDGLVGGFPIGFGPALVTGLVITAGYTGTAAALLRLARARQGLSSVTDVASFLAITTIGTFVTASLAVLVAGKAIDLPRELITPSIQQFFIGDLTGIVSLLPVLLTISKAADRWREAPPVSRIGDLGIFLVGLCCAFLVVFGVAHPQELQFFYLLLLPVAWIGVRHGLSWSAVAILIEQLAVVFIISDLGYQSDDFLAFQILSLAVAATGLILGSVVTERQRAERQLREQQVELSRVARLTTAGALGAAVVHEISQPLATVATYAHVCQRLLTSPPVELPLLAQTMVSIEAEIHRAGDIVERLRALLGKNEQHRCIIDPGSLARKVATLLSEEARAHGVLVRTDLEAVCGILADPVQIEQVLMNLIRNAIEAAADQEGRGGLVSVSLRQTDGDVQIAVEDNGRGVSPDVASHLFEPFETSKLRGMGLGLWLSREIIKVHGGALLWEATVTKGARFVLSLPCDRVQRP